MASGEQLELFSEAEVEHSTPPEPNRRLPRDYYVTNFHKIIETVKSRYEDLLRESEIEFLRIFCEASPDLQKLFVRLISRKGPWFVVEELEYDEIDSIPNAISEGIESELIGELTRDDIGELLPLLTIRELREIQHHIKLPVKGERKSDLIDALSSDEVAKSVYSVISSTYQVIGPAHADFLRVLTLLFFGNSRQSLSDFVIRDLGHVQYETYSIDPKFRSFNARHVIEQRLLITDMALEVGEAIANRDLDKIENLLKQINSQNWDQELTRKLDKLIVQIAYEYERAEQWEEALTLYRTTDLYPSRERRARIYEKQEDLDRALDVALRIEKNPSCEEEKDFSRIFIPRITKKLGEPVQQIRHHTIPVEELEIEKPATTRIEEAVLSALECERGYFTQNRLWKSAFGLTFWDIIFVSIDGAFENRFQYAPLDLFESEFVAKRADLIQERLATISDHALWLKSVKEMYEKKQGIANAFVYWDEDLKEPLFNFLELMKPLWIERVFDIMLLDLRRYCKGFPDLFVVQSGRPKFIEVKGPGDVIQPTQRMWLEEFQKIGIPSSVLKVSWKS
jgi:hypothetical protein